MSKNFVSITQLRGALGKEHQGYLPGDEGPFRCDHCEYYSGQNRCRNTAVIQWAKEHRFGLKCDEASGKAVVQPDGCCDFFEKK